ncbi:MAG TPA: sensor domain-containing diguanylate cyclase, partial [Kofleriaceae bacterium]|nr:sensor domain-containing diguanylate cyclase [Kofleriaceae bacterium]
MAETPGTVPSATRLLSIIELQNALAAAAFNTDEIMRIVADRAAALCSTATATVELVEGDDVVCRAAAGASQQLGLRRSQKSTLSGRCVEQCRPVHDDTWTRICVPIIHGEHAVGVLSVHAPKHGKLDVEDLETLRLLAQIIAIPLHRTRSFPRPRYDNTHDALTGLLNRRAFEERVKVELARRTRYAQSFSLALLDLDGFNTANDRFGEAAGDELLRTIGTILSKHTRVMDACFRLGGDEFAIIMPGTALEGAKNLAERFRSQIAEA